MSKEIKIQTYDTTLRDGAQTPGVKFNVDNKKRIVKQLNAIRVNYIEIGWPESNPTDKLFLEELESHRFDNSQIVSFRSTEKIGNEAKNDIELENLLKSGIKNVAIVAKASETHVKKVLETNLDSNLKIIQESIARPKNKGLNVFFDAEHFFDGFKENPSYTLDCLRTAQKAGADVIVLCDSNGGSTPEFIFETVRTVKQELGEDYPLGIHAHNDSELAVANSLYAVMAGAIIVQGTINGLGERCGNTNLCSLLPTLQYKDHIKDGEVYKISSNVDLIQLTNTARIVELESVVPIPHGAPYVTNEAFTNKAGYHTDAHLKLKNAYFHIPPELVGQTAHTEHSDQGGRANALEIAKKWGYDLKKTDPEAQEISDAIKKLRSVGDAQEYLLCNRIIDKKSDPFVLVWVYTEHHWAAPFSTDYFDSHVQVGINKKTIWDHKGHSTKGELHAFDMSLRNALQSEYPQVRDVQLLDYRVKLTPGQFKTGTASEVEVDMEFGADGKRWTSIRRGHDLGRANRRTLADGYKFYILQTSQ